MIAGTIRRITIALPAAFVPAALPGYRMHAAERAPLSFDVSTSVAHQQLSPDFCWMHPRAATIPAASRDGQPAVIMTLQKHLAASDHYSGLHFMRSNDLGRTWSAPAAIPELAWQKDGEVTIAVADVTPGWHQPTRKLLAIGTQVRYSQAGEQLLDRPRAHQCAYAALDPGTGAWSRWSILTLPEDDPRFDRVAAGCVQWLTTREGGILLPVYFRAPRDKVYSSAVLHCRFDGEKLEYVRRSKSLTVTDPRGLYEPSLAEFQGKYYLTLRNDMRGYVSTSDDGLEFGPVQPWRFDDGTELGSYNTQQHWLVHSDGLFLSYTRRGAGNDHIFRHRAPLFIAKVDAEKLCVIRATERVLIPERGAALGNFGACAITRDESWVTDAEFVMGKSEPRGANGSVYVAKIRWSRPNELIK